MVGVLTPFYVTSSIFYQITITKMNLWDYQSTAQIIWIIFSFWIGLPIGFLCLVYIKLFGSWIKGAILDIYNSLA